jgi:hypothetical protein
LIRLVSGDSIATGENLFSLQNARNLIRYGGLRPDRDTIHVDPRSPTLWCSTCASRTCSVNTAGRRDAASRTAGTSSPCTSPPPLYRHTVDGRPAWKLRALGQEWADGLDGLARVYGVDVE